MKEIEPAVIKNVTKRKVMKPEKVKTEKEKDREAENAKNCQTISTVYVSPCICVYTACTSIVGLYIFLKYLYQSLEILAKS